MCDCEWTRYEGQSRTCHIVTAALSKEGDLDGSLAAGDGHRLGGSWAGRPEMELAAEAREMETGHVQSTLLSVGFICVVSKVSIHLSTTPLGSSGPSHSI